MEYVLGFLFSSNGSHVALIQKNHPEWQAGKWNGIGGKMKESDLSKQAAMIREFKEEAGLSIKSWVFCLILHAAGHQVYIFRAFDDRVAKVTTKEEETVRLFPMGYLPELMVLNSRWMIPLLLDNMHWPISFLENPR